MSVAKTADLIILMSMCPHGLSFLLADGLPDQSMRRSRPSRRHYWRLSLKPLGSD